MTTERKRTRADYSTEPEASVPAARSAPRYNELRWLRRIAGIAMVVLAFWTAGQFFITKAFVLLVFAGIWALMHGISESSAPSCSAACPSPPKAPPWRRLFGTSNAARGGPRRRRVRRCGHCV